MSRVGIDQPGFGAAYLPGAFRHLIRVNLSRCGVVRPCRDRQGSRRHAAVQEAMAAV